MSKKVGILILGGARSGKSRFAQELAETLGKNVLFVATGEPLDEEMKRKIAEHKRNRPPTWKTVEAPYNTVEQIEQHVCDADVVLLDCMTLLVSNLLGNRRRPKDAEATILSYIEKLANFLNQIEVSWIVVSNEVGMGLVPETKLGRIYRDILGKVNQLLARQAAEVYLMVAGIPVKIKG